jgi:hypothetical protein
MYGIVSTVNQRDSFYWKIWYDHNGFTGIIDEHALCVDLPAGDWNQST